MRPTFFLKIGAGIGYSPPAMNSRQALDPALYPELLDYHIWLGADLVRRLHIANAVAASLGEEFRVDDTPPEQGKEREDPAEWSDEELDGHYDDLGSAVRTAPFRILHQKTGIPFQIVPGGSYLMGYSEDEEAYFSGDEFRNSERAEIILESDELEPLHMQTPAMRPVHEVSLKPYLLAEIPLTGEMLEHLGLNLKKSNVRRIFESPTGVTYVLPEEAHKLLSKNKFRLPSESEWEHACRAGTRTLFFWGNEIPEQPNDKVNRFGLADLGNHAELCADGWHDSYANAPDDGSAWEGDAQRLVTRGGAASCFPWQDCGEWQLMMSALRNSVNVSAKSTVDKQVAIRPAISIELAIMPVQQK